MAKPSKIIFIVGGTGAQGIPIIEASTKDGAYAVRVLTRDPNSTRAQELAKLPNVELQAGKLDNDDDLRKGFEGAWGAFVNIDGFVIGQKNETFWGLRSYQLAHEAGVKYFIWGNLDYVLREANYNPEFRCGHYDAKGAVGAWILAQDAWHAERAQTPAARDKITTRASLFTTGPYLDMALAAATPMSPRYAADGTVEWRLPLGPNGAVAHIALEDCGKYVRWMFDHAFDPNSDAPGRLVGTDFAVATAHIRYSEVATAFTKITGRPARFTNVSDAEFWSLHPDALKHHKFGLEYSSMPEDDGSIMDFEQNFSGFWRMWQASGGEDPLIKRDYKLMDEILPDRIRSVEEFFERNREKCLAVAEGSLGTVIKRHEDVARKRARGPQL